MVSCFDLLYLVTIRTSIALQSIAYSVPCNLVKSLSNTSIQEFLSLLVIALLQIQHPLSAIVTESTSAEP
jgi:hypothetical protein